jgi:capsular polysaccharide biosynthesis protein
MPDYVEEVSLMDYLNVMWKRKWLIIIPTILTAVVAGIVSFFMPPQWEIDSIILPAKFLTQTQAGQFEEVVVSDPKQIAGQINQRSYDNLIAAELNLDVRKFPKIKAENLRDTKLVRISLRDNDITRAKDILNSLFNHLKRDLDKKIDVEIKGVDTKIEGKRSEIKQKEIVISDLENEILQKRLQIKDRENEIKTTENEIKKLQNNIAIKEIEIQSKEVEKEKTKKEIESLENKMKISEDRAGNILNEMKAVKQRIDEIVEQQKKALAEKRQSTDAVSLLLYSNEIQQNVRYYNTLDEQLSNEKITRENLDFSIRGKEAELRLLDNQINQIKAEIETVRADIKNLETKKEVIKTEIEKINGQIKTVNNEIQKTKTDIGTIEKEIGLLEDQKGRIDYTLLIKEPTPSLYPVSPRKRVNVAIAGILGLFMFTMLAFFIEYISKQEQNKA